MRLVAGAALAHAALEAGTWTNTNALGSSECYAPTEEGGWGYCGAPTCRNQYIWRARRPGQKALFYFWPT